MASPTKIHPKYDALRSKSRVASRSDLKNDRSSILNSLPSQNRYKLKHTEYFNILEIINPILIGGKLWDWVHSTLFLSRFSVQNFSSFGQEIIEKIELLFQTRPATQQSSCGRLGRSRCARNSKMSQTDQRTDGPINRHGKV